MAFKPKRSDSATAADADWSFLEIEGLEQALRARAVDVGRRHRVDADDLYQEAVLFLAVRPLEVRDSYSKGGMAYVASFAGRGCMNRRADAEHNQQHEHYDPFAEEAEWQSQ